MSLSLKVDRQDLIVTRANNHAHVFINRCPHLDLSLSQRSPQLVDSSERYLVCSNHGAHFEILSGTCVSGPCSGAKLQRVAAQEFDGAIWLVA